MKGVILYKCGRNINRVYRLCYIYGIKDLYLLNCENPKLGNVFSANGNVNVHEISDLAQFPSVAALEKGKGNPLNESIREYDYLILGGENVTLNSKLCKDFFHIKTPNSLCLTVDEALAVGLDYATR